MTIENKLLLYKMAYRKTRDQLALEIISSIDKIDRRNPFYKEILELVRKQAYKGNVTSQYLLGKYYGIYRKNGIKWLDRASEQGNIDAIIKLIQYYKRCKDEYIGDPHNYIGKMFYYAEKGAKLNNSLCMYYVGYCYAYERKLKETLYWYKKSRDEGNEFCEKINDHDFLDAKIYYLKKQIEEEEEMK